MIALDTNVLVRFLVNDDKSQAARARALIDKQPTFIAPAVLLETEWVLRAAYDFSARDIAGFFRALLGLPGVTPGEPAAVAEALRSYESGLDFADALHLATSSPARAFASFDAKFIKRARKISVHEMMSL